MCIKEYILNKYINISDIIIIEILLLLYIFPQDIFLSFFSKALSFLALRDGVNYNMVVLIVRGH